MNTIKMVKSFVLLWLVVSFNLSAIEPVNFYNPDTNRIIASIVYHENTLEPVPKMRSFFFYDECGRKILTVVDNGSSLDFTNPEGVTERLITSYKHHPKAPNDEYPTEIIEKFQNVTSGEEKLLLHIIHTYTSELTLMQQVIIDRTGNLIETRFDSSGRPLSIFEHQESGALTLTDFRYDPRGRIESLTRETEQGIHLIHYEYNEAGALVNIHYVDSPSDFLSDIGKVMTEHWGLYPRLIDCFSELFWDFTKVNEETIFQDFRQEFEHAAGWISSPTLLRLFGYESYPARRGVYGNGEVHDKVRISLINGILNFPEHHLENLELFSESHAGINIHYIFRPCEGWSRDLMHCAMAKCGIISAQAHELALLWKTLIQDMGGVNGGGVIIHYAHSIGGTETYAAKSLMTPDELKMIRVYTLASATIIPNNGFAHVENYVSIHDGIPSVVDPVNFIWGLFDPQSNVTYLNEPTSPFYPLDHLIANESYRGVLRELGQQFIETHGVLIK